MRVDDRLTGSDHVLVAFDGPVADLPALPLAERLRVLLGETGLPRRVAKTGDPFAVVAHAESIGPATGRALYAHLCRIEFELVAGARPAAGVAGAFAAMAAAGTRLTVVSGLHAEAVRSFLVVHGLAGHVRHLSARTGRDAAPPPAPDLVAAALRDEVAVFVGATAADLAAARAAGVATVRFRGAPVDQHWNHWFAALSAPPGRLP